MAKCKNSYRPSIACSQTDGKTKGNDDMIELIDYCVDCGLPCIHSSCPYYKRDYVVCDVCGAPIRPAEREDYNYIEYVCDRCYEKIYEKIQEEYEE